MTQYYIRNKKDWGALERSDPLSRRRFLQNSKDKIKERCPILKKIIIGFHYIQSTAGIKCNNDENMAQTSFKGEFPSLESVIFNKIGDTMQAPLYHH